MKTKHVFMGVLLVGVSILLSGCNYTTVPEKVGASNLTVGEAKRTITKGTTTQSEILTTFGSPNLVSNNKDGNQVWAYNRMSADSYSGSEGGSLILWGGSKAVSSTTVKSFDLIITFNNKDVVEDYKVIYASY